MIDKTEGTLLDNEAKTLGLNNPETYVLTHNSLNTFLVLIFSDLNKAQIYKIPDRNTPHHEIEILISFKKLNLFKPSEQTEDYYNRGPNDENFLSEIEEIK